MDVFFFSKWLSARYPQPAYDWSHQQAFASVGAGMEGRVHLEFRDAGL